MNLITQSTFLILGTTSIFILSRVVIYYTIPTIPSREALLENHIEHGATDLIRDVLRDRDLPGVTIAQSYEITLEFAKKQETLREYILKLKADLSFYTSPKFFTKPFTSIISKYFPFPETPETYKRKEILSKRKERDTIIRQQINGAKANERDYISTIYIDAMTEIRKGLERRQEFGRKNRFSIEDTLFLYEATSSHIMALLGVAGSTAIIIPSILIFKAFKAH